MIKNTNRFIKNMIVLLCVITLICLIASFTIKHFYSIYNERKIQEQQCIDVISEKALEKLDNVGFIKVLKYDAQIDRYMILVANEEDNHAIVYQMRYFENKEDCVPIVFMEMKGPDCINDILAMGR